MIDAHLIAKTSPTAKSANLIFWKTYRITVLGESLFRLENSPEKKFRDAATQSIWFRDMPETEFETKDGGDYFIVKTSKCVLTLRKDRKDCRIRLKGRGEKTIDNKGNLLGTYRTLDSCDGSTFYPAIYTSPHLSETLKLFDGVCSKTGIAVLNDEKSLTLGNDGMVKDETGSGTDEYIFAFGNDYKAAVKALYSLTGYTPIVPRFALGNWWSRYYAYTDEEYLRVITRFEERGIPLTVATIDMDWHYSSTVDNDFKITELGRNTEYYGGASGWTGYTWNKSLFPNYKAFLKKIKEHNLKITLNLHPADGVRWWEDFYPAMAKAVGKDPAALEHIKFNLADESFINAYFKVLHKPYEKDGVSFWWIDWQQGQLCEGMKEIDPLWALNHFHYLDNALNHDNPLILSRYSGIGSHRYPLGFSGDTIISWETLKFLSYFTLTATNVGYTWWSHDIGGHFNGEQKNELYVRHIQFGVFSPINRLHSCNMITLTKEPWYYSNGAGNIAEKMLKLRHSLIPFLYTASKRTHDEGVALIEPLYYYWDCRAAYKYKTEYVFGGQFIVSPVVSPLKKDGYARTKVWIPEGVWTDIFTGEQYVSPKGGSERVLYRTLDSIPVLAKEGAILPLSEDKGNSIENPRNLTVRLWEGTNDFSLYEDGREQKNTSDFYTDFKSENFSFGEKRIQKITISSRGNRDVIPTNRILKLVFEGFSADSGLKLYVNGKARRTTKIYADNPTVKISFNPDDVYTITCEYRKICEREKLLSAAKNVLLHSEGVNSKKSLFFNSILDINSDKDLIKAIDCADLTEITKLKLKETL